MFLWANRYLPNAELASRYPSDDHVWLEKFNASSTNQQSDKSTDCNQQKDTSASSSKATASREDN